MTVCSAIYRLFLDATSWQGVVEESGMMGEENIATLLG